MTASATCLAGRRSTSAQGGQPMVSVQNVVKRFGTSRGGLLAVDDVSFDIRAGEFVSLLGPSGCGKSTIQKTVAGLQAVTSGQIRVAGQIVTGPVTNLGIVFQDAALLDWRDVLANVMVQIEMRRSPRAPGEAYARELLRQLGLTGFEHAYPNELSGGMRQRVSIARSLVHKPPLLLMDEPFSALDAMTRDTMNMLLHLLWKTYGTTVMFITHSLADAVLLSERVLVMSPRPGRIVQEVVIDLPEERTLATRESPAFTAHIRKLRETFETLGVL